MKIYIYIYIYIYICNLKLSEIVPLLLFIALDRISSLKHPIYIYIYIKVGAQLIM